MTIRIDSDDINRFADVIRSLVVRGLGFDVIERGGFFVITLNGGF